MIRKRRFCALAAALLILPAWGQVGMRAGTASNSPAPAAVATSAPTAAGDVMPILAQIQSVAQSTTADVSLLGIRKWKVGNDIKSDAQAKAEAIQRNLTVALPGMISQVQNAPSDLLANFKLYRTMGVLYDVMSSLAESAGAFGSKGEFDGLASDLSRMDQARRALGDRLEALAASKDAEIARLQNQVKAQQAAVTPQPKKIIVDDEEKAQKNSEKKSAKKPATKKKPPATSQTQPANPQ